MLNRCSSITLVQISKRGVLVFVGDLSGLLSFVSKYLYTLTDNVLAYLVIKDVRDPSVL